MIWLSVALTDCPTMCSYFVLPVIDVLVLELSMWTDRLSMWFSVVNLTKC